MAIRNWVFKSFNRLAEYNAAVKLSPMIAQDRNEELISQSQAYKTYADIAKQIQNEERIAVSQKDDLSRQKFEILKKFNQEGLLNDNVDANQVLQQVERINFLQKLKLMQDNPYVYDRDEVEFYRLLGKYHLEEQNAEENLEAYLVQKPWMRKYSILSYL